MLQLNRAALTFEANPKNRGVEEDDIEGVHGDDLTLLI